MGNKCSCLDADNSILLQDAMQKPITLTEKFNLPIDLLQSHPTVKYYSEFVIKHQAQLKDKLDISNKSFTDAQFQQLLQLLPYYQHVVRLQMNNVQLTGLQIRLLSDHLCLLKGLRVFDIGNNQIGNEGAAYIAQGLDQANKLEVLNLENTGINHIGLRWFLSKLQNIKELCLRGNNLQADGAILVNELSANLQRLVVLDFEANNLGIFGSKILADTFSLLKQLKQLNLQSNSIRNIGLYHLSLQLPVQLTHLNLSDNQITNEGLKEMIPRLQLLDKLQVFHLNMNPIQDEGAELIEEFLSSNKQLAVLSLKQCQISKSKRLLRLSFPTTDILFN